MAAAGPSKSAIAAAYGRTAYGQASGADAQIGDENDNPETPVPQFCSPRVVLIDFWLRCAICRAGLSFEEPWILNLGKAGGSSGSLPSPLGLLTRCALVAQQDQTGGKTKAKTTFKRKQPDVDAIMLTNDEKGIKKLMIDMGGLAEAGRFTGKRGNEVREHPSTRVLPVSHPVLPPCAASRWTTLPRMCG